MKAVGPVLAALFAAGLLWLLTAPLHGGSRHGMALWLGIGGTALVAAACAVVRARRRAAWRRNATIAVVPLPRAGRRVADSELRKG
ncbi:hypothetical protein [Amycolatopsis solani]|uniref:hypothetical protein n=1 Tax=Amycolatopsis solani TaxID=3028615 RepID=UPI0025B1C32D|nr:hypothetical protein [Amycolatopsis sp. MEP2-6]